MMAIAPTETRQHVISFRVTDSELTRIEAAATNMVPIRTPQDWCRAAALHCARARIPQPPPPRRHPARRLPKADIRLLAEILGHLGRIGGNINQIARRLNQLGPSPDAATVADIHAEVAQAAANIRRALEGGDDGH